MLFEEHGQWPCPAAWVNQPLDGCTERSGVQLGVLLKATNLQETTKKTPQEHLSSVSDHPA